MKLFPDFSTIVELGPFVVRWYGVLIVGGAYLALYFSARSFKKTMHQYDLISDLFIGAMIAGVIGARLWFVFFFDLGWYLADPIRIVMTQEGGMAIQGGLLFGIAYGVYFCKKHKLDFFRLADMVLPNVLLAQAIGRWGNFMNHEAFGRIVEESFYNGWPSWLKSHMFIDGYFREPTFLYESVACVVGWILIQYGVRKFNQYKRGDLASAYLMWYGVIRLIIETFRSDSLMYGGLKTAQVVSIVFIIVGLMGWFGVFRKMFKKKPVMLFDFDGTLADTQELILQTFRALFKKNLPDYELTSEDEMKLIGPPLKESLPWFFDEEKVDELIEEYVSLNRELHEKYIREIPNATELLKWLKAEGYQVGIVSSKFSGSLQLGVSLLEFGPYFDTIVGLDHVEKHKPNPEGILKACELLGASLDDIVYVGDSAADIEAGKNAQAYTIGYIFEEKREQALIDSKPNQVISDLLEIKEILKGEHGWTDNLT